MKRLDRSRAILVVSPHAARVARHIDRARSALVSNGADIVEELTIDAVDHLPSAVRGRNATHVVVAGGDGTVGTVADQIANSGTVLLIMPLGTSNDFARSLRIPMNVDAAASLLGRGNVSRIDLGRLDAPNQISRRFVHAATVGLNVNFAKLATRASIRQRFGRLTYVVVAALTIRQVQTFTCRLGYGGQTENLDLTQLSVINAPVFGGFLGLRVRGSRSDDGLLDVLAVRALPTRRILLAGLYQLLHLKRPLEGVRALHPEELVVDSDEQLDVSLDGEIAGKLPCRFAVDEKALRIVTPADFENRGD